MKIKYADGRGETVASEGHAREILGARYPGVQYSDWEQSGTAPARMLVWADAKSATNDDGSHAVAAIIA